MIFYQVPVGGDRNYGYFVADEATRKAAVVDASYTPQKLVDLAREHQAQIVYILSTHDHGDHTNGNRAAKRATGAQIVLHKNAFSPHDIAVDDGDELPLGELTLKIIHTPGHTDDSICILVEDILLTGDTLFVGKVGGTDYGEGARKEYNSLHNKLMTLDDHIRVYPGHHYGVQPYSTIGHERRTNPFLLRTSFDDFVELKINWLEYKRQYGIS